VIDHLLTFFDSQNSQTAIDPPKWQAGSTGETAELTFLHGGWLGFSRRCTIGTAVTADLWE
jgi:hypothetical protein